MDSLARRRQSQGGYNVPTPGVIRGHLESKRTSCSTLNDLDAAVPEKLDMSLHRFLDWTYGADGDTALRRMLDDGADTDEREGPFQETPLHVATRRRRVPAVEILLDHGAEIDATTKGGKTAYAHAVRRGFDDVAAVLRARGASDQLNAADRFAVAVVNRQFAEARAILEESPGIARSGNPEEDRLLADVAGRHGTEAVELLIGCGADLTATALDDGTPLHQAAWFGQPENARLLIDAGAPLDVFDAVHHKSPIGWAVHGSRYSGGAEERQQVYLALVRLLLESGSSLHYPGDPKDNSYLQLLLDEASPLVAVVLKIAGGFASDHEGSP
jgi:ankyrin repeat protein